MYACVYMVLWVCMSVCMRMCVCVYVYVYVYVYVSVLAHVYVYMDVYVYTCMCMCICVNDVPTFSLLCSLCTSCPSHRTFSHVLFRFYLLRSLFFVLLSPSTNCFCFPMLPCVTNAAHCSKIRASRSNAKQV